MKQRLFFLLTLCCIQHAIWAQQTNPTKDPIIEALINEAETNSQLETLAHQLLDKIGPRLTRTPQMKKLTTGPWQPIPNGEFLRSYNNGALGKDGAEESPMSI